jgi:hypothetical protein
MMVAGDEVLVSLNPRTGKVAKYCCSEQCRQDFDYWFWNEVARRRAMGLKDRRP